MIILHNKNEIKSYLQEDTFLHIYSLGDLDDFFWNYTIWYALKEEDEIRSIILLYVGQPLPVVLALSNDTERLKTLLSSIRHLLPGRFYAHLSPGVEETLQKHYTLKSHGKHLKMALKDPSLLNKLDTSNVTQLLSNDFEAIEQLYKASYPGNWFDPRMLETKQYFGIRADDRLLSIAGIHVYSETYNVAALGNITTHPDYRGQGLGKAVTAKLCQSLKATVDNVGLNVKADNFNAIALYEKLGFEVVNSYNEVMVETK